MVNLKLSSAGTAADPAKLLAGIDALDSAAPTAIKVDFHRFDRFQHAVLQPGSGTSAADLQGSDTETALQHVAAYLQAACKIT